MVTIGLLSAALLVATQTTQSIVGPTQSFKRFEIQGVALSSPPGTSLQTCLRVWGELPTDGIWCLKVESVLHEDGTPITSSQPLTSSADITANELGPIGYSPIKGSAVPQKVRLTGELVHYRSVEELVTLPTVHLVHTPSKVQRQPAMRDWLLPEHDSPRGKTPRGLVVQYGKLGGYGYSGPGYEDRSWLPVTVDPPTINLGLERELKDCRAQSVDRVDAYEKPDRIIPIYQDTPKTESGLFGASDKDFSPDVRLSLHVIRRIVDRRFTFSLLVGVQTNKDLFEQHKGVPDPARIVVWPSSTR